MLVWSGDQKAPAAEQEDGTEGNEKQGIDEKAAVVADAADIDDGADGQGADEIAKVAAEPQQAHGGALLARRNDIHGQCADGWPANA